jgi:hypothetical protein
MVYFGTTLLTKDNTLVAVLYRQQCSVTKKVVASCLLELVGHTEEDQLDVHIGCITSSLDIVCSSMARAFLSEHCFELVVRIGSSALD